MNTNPTTPASPVPSVTPTPPSPSLQQRLEQTTTGRAVLSSGKLFELYGKPILIGLAVLVVALVGISLWRSSANTQAAVGWADLLHADTAPKLEEVADKYPGTSIGQWAKLRAGELQLETGIENVIKDHELAQADFKQAREAFQSLLDSTAIQPQIRERAVLGLARTLEAASSGETDPAIEQYNALLRDYPTSVYRTYAEARIKALESKDTQDFYKWLSQQKSPTDTLPKPKDAIPGAAPAVTTPATGSSVPTTPELPGATTPATEAPAAKPAESAPAQPDAPKAESPKAEAPATATTPAEATPAPDAPAAPAPATDTPQ